MTSEEDESIKKISYTLALKRALDPSDPPLRVLDVGCGDGSWLRKLGKVFPHAELHGVDILPASEVINLDVGFSYHQTSALSLPFPSSHFHVVHTRKLLSSVSDFLTLIAETSRVLAPGGLGVWVEGRNVANSRTTGSGPTEGRNASGSGTYGLKGLMAKKMMAGKGLEGDLASSLSGLLERNGLSQVSMQELSPHRPDDSSSPQDLGFDLDGADEGSATMYAFYGVKI